MFSGQRLSAMEYESIEFYDQYGGELTWFEQQQAIVTRRIQQQRDKREAAQLARYGRKGFGTYCAAAPWHMRRISP